MIEEIKKLMSEGKSYRQIAEDLNISLGKVQRILRSDTVTDTVTDTLPKSNTDNPDTDTVIQESETKTDTVIQENKKKVNYLDFAPYFNTKYDNLTLNELKNKRIIPENYIKWSSERTKEQDIKINLILPNWFYNDLNIRKFFKWDIERRIK